MIPTTPEYKNQIKAVVRDIHARVRIDYTDTETDQSVDVIVNSRANVCYPEQVADGILAPSGKYACLDGSWELGEYDLAPSSAKDGQMGWWSEHTSDANGDFITYVPGITVTFSPRAIKKITLAGDSLRNEYPVDFGMTFWDIDELPVRLKSVTNNDKIVWEEEYSDPETQIARIDLSITKWSKPNSQVKILEFVTSIQETYEDDDIISINFLEEKETSHGSIPVGNITSEEIEVVLNNETRQFDEGNKGSPLYGRLKPNRRIQAWIGPEDEMIPLGVQWSRGWKAPDDGVTATVRGRGRLDRLASTEYKTSPVFVDVDLYDLAEAVFMDAGLKVGQYWIDPYFKTVIVPYAWFDTQSHRDALRIIAEAGLGQVFCNRYGVIRVEGPDYTVGIEDAYRITSADYFKKSNPSREGKVANRIIVETQPLTVASATEEIYRSTTPIPITTDEVKEITVRYNTYPCVAVSSTFSGPAVLEDYTAYAWGHVIKIKGTGNGEITNLVTYGKPLTVENREVVTKEDAESISDNGPLEYTMPKNPLIQTREIAELICDKLLAFYKDPRSEVKTAWRGDPSLELGDVIVTQDYTRGDGEDGYYRITRQEIDYDGGLRADLEGRRV